MKLLAIRGHVKIIDWDLNVRRLVLEPGSRLFKNCIDKLGKGIIDRRTGWIDMRTLYLELDVDRKDRIGKSSAVNIKDRIAFKDSMAKELLWDSVWQILVSFLQFERVVAVEIPLTASRPTWYPPLNLTEKIFFWHLWWTGRIDNWRLCWLFLEVSRRFPMPLFVGACAAFAASAWVSILFSGEVGVSLVAMAILLVLREIQRKIPTVAGVYFLAVLVSALQIYRDPTALPNIYWYMSEIAGGGGLGHLCAFAGMLLGATPLMGLFVVYNLTIVSMHSNLLTETGRYQKKLDTEWQYAVENMEHQHISEKVVEFFCKKYADHVITNIHTTRAKTLEWDVEHLLNMVQVRRPRVRIILFAAVVMTLWIQCEKLGFIYQIIAMILALSPMLVHTGTHPSNRNLPRAEPAESTREHWFNTPQSLNPLPRH